jgi:cephalosporin hydroxylase
MTYLDRKTSLRSKILENELKKDENGESFVDKFHKLYYGAGDKSSVIENTFWLGIQTLKCPLDLWAYQEIIFKLKPDLIIETGTANGGSALYLATICNVINKGKIVTIDIIKKDFPQHERIKYITGSSLDQKIVEEVKSLMPHQNCEVLVILDSDHTKNHVLKEMEIYSKLVQKGSYIIVEDTDINGHPVRPGFGDGPMEAVYEFLKTHDEFIIDKEKEKFIMTCNPNGYLKKIK